MEAALRPRLEPFAMANGISKQEPCQSKCDEKMKAAELLNGFVTQLAPR